jgi:Outer membrane protein beta-barrel domain
MTSLRSQFVSAAVLIALAAFAVPALAQDGKITASINFGAQTGSGDLSTTLTPEIYLETATIHIAQTYKSRALFDIGGSYLFFEKFGGKIGAGLAYSHTSGDGNATIAAQIPDPEVSDVFRSAASAANGLNHTEDAVHLSLIYRYPVTPKLDVTVSLGPTFFSVKQDLVSNVNVAETTTLPPFGTPNLTPVIVKGSDSPVGVNIGADATYMVTKTFGAGLLLRYAHGTASITPAANAAAVEIRAGGFQVAVGLRARF